MKEVKGNATGIPNPRDSGSQSPQIGFIVGVPRSGTTLLSAILNRHSSIAVTPETHFFRILFDDPIIRQAMLDDLASGLRQYFDRLDSIRRDKNEAWAPSVAEIISFCNGDHRPENVFSALCRLLAKPKNDTLLILEKTPSHLLHTDAIRKFFPKASVIHVIRDGRDVASSLSHVYWSTDDHF